MLSINLTPPGELLKEIGSLAKQARLDLNFSRETLAERSGVSASSIKRFESTGLISLPSLIEILIALDRIDELNGLFKKKEKYDFDMVEKKPYQRQRGMK